MSRGALRVKDMTDEQLNEAVRTGKLPFDDWAERCTEVSLTEADWMEAARRLQGRFLAIERENTRLKAAIGPAAKLF